MHVANAPSKMPPAPLVQGGVYALLAIVGIVVVFATLPALQRVRASCGMGCAAGNQAYEIGKSLELFKLHRERYPSMQEGLAVLLAPPKGRALLDALPKDPWGNDYAYAIPGVMNPASFDVRSAGADRSMFTDDDVGNWRRE